MRPDELDHLLKNLEQGAADELSELESLGAAFYPTGQLLRLRGQWEIKHTLFRKFQRFFVGAVATSPIWLLLWGLCLKAGLPRLGFIFLALFPFSFLLFFFGLYFMNTFFKGQGHLDRVGEMISQELQRRQEKK
ncbi:MAG: hypothetical protein RIC19_25070 [Phaeodactylibacter sp.]|uniref:hypothetical protein n=1 Tax=Phaeodactylibacter sp. TaxID=1940289 RepID=UPI0032ECBF61